MIKVARCVWPVDHRLVSASNPVDELISPVGHIVAISEYIV